MISRLSTYPRSDAGDVEDEDTALQPQRLMDRASSMGALMRVRHTAELIALAPSETQRALVEIQQSAVLRRFYDTASEMGLRNERCRSIKTVDELNDVVGRVRWLLSRVTWNARRLASIARWLLRSVLCIQRFVRVFIPKLRRRKASVLRMWKAALSGATAMLRRQTVDHVRRYRISLLHGTFRDEAFGLVSDILIPEDDVRLAVESIWRLRIDRYRETFRQRQRQGRCSMLQRLDTAMDGREAASSPPAAASRRLPRTTSLAASRTLTFRRLRLKRIDFDVPSLLFGAAYVTTAEICVHLQLMKLRQVRDAIASYQHHAECRTASAGDAGSAVGDVAPPLRVAPLDGDEQSELHRLLRVHQATKAPVTYTHALLAINSQTQWFTLYCLRQLRRQTELAPGAASSDGDAAWAALGIIGTPPEALVGQLAAAQSIYASWRRRGSTEHPRARGSKDRHTSAPSRGAAWSPPSAALLRQHSPPPEAAIASHPPACRVSPTISPQPQGRTRQQPAKKGAQWAATVHLDAERPGGGHEAASERLLQHSAEEAVWRGALACHIASVAKAKAHLTSIAHKHQPSSPRCESITSDSAADRSARPQRFQPQRPVERSWETWSGETPHPWSFAELMAVKGYSTQQSSRWVPLVSRLGGGAAPAPPASATPRSVHRKPTVPADGELAKDLDALLVTRRFVPAAAAGRSKPQRPATAPSRRGRPQR